jgi:hypothetical protein
MRNNVKLGIAFLIGVVFAMLIVPMLMPAEAKVDVEIYKNRESGDLTYCETGTLADPPMEHLGSGKIRESMASGC